MMKGVDIMKYLIAVILLLTVAACTAPQQFVCPDGSVVASSADCQTPEPAQPEPTVVEPEPVQPEPEPTESEALDKAELASDVEELFEVHESKVKSYRFLHSPIEKVGGSIRQTQDSTYLVRGDLVKVEKNRPVSVDTETYVDTVYLDLSAMTATGYCMSRNKGTCSVEGEERDASYSDYKIKLPPEYLDDVNSDAKIVGTINFESREVVRVRWTDGPLYGEMYVDDFMGLPLRVAYYSDDEYGDIVRGVEFLEIAYNQVKDEDVTP